MDLGLKGKKAIITGGSKGIGLATAHVLADEGVDVAICSRKIDDVNAALEALKGKGVNAIGSVADVADGDSFKAWMASTIEELGGLDILVPQVSAGGGDPSEKGWEANFQTDIMGTVRAVESSLEALRASSGSIVMISTTTAIEEGPGSGPYGAVKAGLLNYSNHLAQTEGANGVRSNVICPGPIYIDGGPWNYIKDNMGSYICKIIEDSRPAYAKDQTTLKFYFEKLKNVSTLTLEPFNPKKPTLFYKDIKTPNPFFTTKDIQRFFFFHSIQLIQSIFH